MHPKELRLEFSVKEANIYIPFILLIGVGIGTANFFLNGDLNWIQWILQSLSTCFLIGYPLVIIAANKSWLQEKLNSTFKLLSTLSLIFFAVGILATEVEQVIKMTIFNRESYHFLSAGNMYIFNGIISLILGFSFFKNKQIIIAPPSDQKALSVNDLDHETETTEPSIPASILTKLPLKQGNVIDLIPIEDIVYLEAYDNYCFAYDVHGDKRLCDYSLLFLQDRLEENFLRIHRKYIVNNNHIKQIKSQPNTRYLISFENKKLEPIMSSKGYAGVIRSLIRIK